MASLVISIGEGKGTWGPCAQVVQTIDWQRIIIVTTDYFKDKFSTQKPSEHIIIDDTKPLPELILFVRDKLSTLEGDVGLNLLSGDGKIHMAILAALMKLPLGIRLISATQQGIEQL